jgi:hypothetical protein
MPEKHEYDVGDAKELVRFWRAHISHLYLAGYSVKTIAVSMWYAAAEILNNDKITREQVRKLMEGVISKIRWNNLQVDEIVERAKRWRWNEERDSSPRE